MISARALRIPLTRLRRSRRDREWLAATLQMLIPALRDVDVKVEFGNPIYAAGANGIGQAVLEETRRLIENGLDASAEPNAEYLADGITESIINTLSQLSHLRVMARSTVFHYKGLEVDPQVVGRALGVSAVLVGRILSYDERLIIRAELVDVKGGWAVWGAQFNRKSSDILEVQEEIAWEIAYNLRIKLTSHVQELLTKRYTEHTEAYRLYLRGRFFWNKYTREAVEKGIEYFQQAIEHDPNYALAYAGLADAYHRLSNLYLPPSEALPKARAAAVKAVELDDLLAEAHASFGLLKMYYDHDWEGTEREYKRAIELHPGNAMSHKRYGEYLMYNRRFDEALEEHKLSLKLDPLSLQGNINLGTTLFLMREYEQSIRQIKKTVELDPGNCPAHMALGQVTVTPQIGGLVPPDGRRYATPCQL
ncbi:MAG: hypothetical protein ICV60_14705 [Pyrinomonadaceae bacterium]|nr:hypothetical protein [Pyrinomonadaceae bacterium]